MNRSDGIEVMIRDAGIKNTHMEPGLLKIDKFLRTTRSSLCTYILAQVFNLEDSFMSRHQMNENTAQDRFLIAQKVKYISREGIHFVGLIHTFYVTVTDN